MLFGLCGGLLLTKWRILWVGRQARSLARCERVYPAIMWVENRWNCPNPARDGGPDDAWEYGPESSLLREHPEYAVEPEVGERLSVKVRCLSG